MHVESIIYASIAAAEHLVVAFSSQWQPQQQQIEYPLIPDTRFNIDTYPDANAREDFRFTCSQLKELTVALGIPHVYSINAGDRLLGVEALAMLCCRLSYPGKLQRIRKQFERSDPACNIIITDLYCYLDTKWSDKIYFNGGLYTERHQLYVNAVYKDGWCGRSDFDVYRWNQGLHLPVG